MPCLTAQMDYDDFKLAEIIMNGLKALIDDRYVKRYLRDLSSLKITGFHNYNKVLKMSCTLIKQFRDSKDNDAGTYDFACTLTKYMNDEKFMSLVIAYILTVRFDLPECMENISAMVESNKIDDGFYLNQSNLFGYIFNLRKVLSDEFNFRMVEVK